MNNPTPDLPQNAASGLTAKSVTLRSKSSGSSRNLGNLLFDEFESKIRQGLLKEGEKLPTESELVRTYEVSRTVVREALSKLQAAALVQHGMALVRLYCPCARVKVRS